jgi:hypothetical protein
MKEVPGVETNVVREAWERPQSDPALRAAKSRAGDPGSNRRRALVDRSGVACHERTVIEPGPSPKDASPSSGGASDVGERDGGALGAGARLKAYLSRNRSRLLRFALLIALLYTVTDLVSSAPQDAMLSLPLDDVRREARAISATDEVEITISEERTREPLTHTRTRAADDVRDLRHTVHLAPGQYTVRLEMRGASPREGRFEIPADGVVRIRWR